MASNFNVVIVSYLLFITKALSYKSDVFSITNSKHNSKVSGAEHVPLGKSLNLIVSLQNYFSSLKLATDRAT